jgi:hypothetical protein
MVGKDMDESILASRWRYLPGGVFATTFMLLNEACASGKRFHAVYNSDGDTLSIDPEQEPSLLHHIRNLLPDGWDTGGEGMSNNNDVYTIFGDDEHPHVTVFHRYQASGNCFLQAPILIHWYKSLWGQKKVDASAISFIHLSKYVRNTFNGERLFQHIVEDGGGDALRTAMDIMPEVQNGNIRSDTSFEDIRAKMETDGPFLVSLNKVLDDMHEEGKFSYTGTRPRKPKPRVVEGHAMVAVGVRKGANDKVHFLVQNCWKGKEFVEMDFDYLKASSAYVDHFGCSTDAGLDNVSPRTYMEHAGPIRVAESSSSLERPHRVVWVR